MVGSGHDIILCAIHNLNIYRVKLHIQCTFSILLEKYIGYESVTKKNSCSVRCNILLSISG